MADMNITDYDLDDITLGQCAILIQNYTAPSGAGVTPTVEIGGVDECTVELNRELLEFRQGTPQLDIELYNIYDSGMLRVKGWEWNVANMYKAYGAGATTGTTTETFDFGGDYTVQKLQVRVVHEFPSGATLWVDLWRIAPTGNLAFNFNPRDFNKFDYEFKILRGAAGWINESLTRGTRLGKVTYTRAP